MEIDLDENSKWFSDETRKEKLTESLQQSIVDEMREWGWENTEENKNQWVQRKKAEIIDNAKNGDISAQHLLSGFYFCGIDKEEDPVRALAWLKIAERNGSSSEPCYFKTDPSPEQFEAGENLARQMIQQNPKLLKE